MVRGSLELNGNNVTIDSYNSSDPAKSVNGQWAASVSGDGGDVICLGSITNAVSVGNALIYGRIYDAAGVFPNLGANGGIGTHAWLSSNFGIEPGYFVPFLNFPFPKVSLPYASSAGLTPAGGTVVTTNSGVAVTNNYDDVLYGGNYFSASPLGNTIVTGPSTLVLPNGYSIASLTIVPGASLTLYVGGTSVSISGNNILNQAGLPGDLIVYCTSNVTSIAFLGNTAFSGVLVAPSAFAMFSAGGATQISFSGAIIINSLVVNGHAAFHFDEALLQEGILPPYPSFAANLTYPAISGSGQFQFNVWGVDGFSYTVETSSNFTDWVPVFTNTAPFTFTDTNASTVGQNFYRAVYYQQ